MRKIIAFILILCLSPLSQCIYSAYQTPKVEDIASVPDSTKAPAIDEYQFNLIMNLIEKYNPRLHIWSRHRIVDQILYASREFELDPFLVASVIAAESSFRPAVTSPCGAQGLMQLIPAVQPALGVRNAYNIEENIRGGCLFLSQLWERFNDTALTLAAYNAGPTRVARLGRVPRIRETQSYVKKVQRLSKQLTEEFFAQLPSALQIYVFHKTSKENFSTKAIALKFPVLNNNITVISESISASLVIALPQKERFYAFASSDGVSLPFFLKQLPVERLKLSISA